MKNVSERKIDVEEADDSCASNSAHEDHVDDTLDLTQMKPVNLCESFVHIVMANSRENSEVEVDELRGLLLPNMSNALSPSPDMHDANSHGHRITMGCRRTIQKEASSNITIMQGADSSSAHAEAGVVLKYLEGDDIYPPASLKRKRGSQENDTEELACDVGLHNLRTTDRLVDSTELYPSYVLPKYDFAKNSARICYHQESKSNITISPRASSSFGHLPHSRHCNIAGMAIDAPTFSRDVKAQEGIYNPAPLTYLAEDHIRLANNSRINTSGSTQNMVHGDDTGSELEGRSPRENRNDDPVNGVTDMDMDLDFNLNDGNFYPPAKQDKQSGV